MAQVIDTLVTRVAFKADNRGLRQAEQGINRFQKRTRQALVGIGRGLRVGVAALAAVGGAAFFTGSTAEREFLKLQTQLGLTAADVAAIRPGIVQLSRETARPLAELAAGYFSLRSAGLDAATAQDTLRASAFAANGQLGSTRDIAHVAGGAINAYGADVISGSRATDILIGTVKAGNLEAENLTRGFGELLQVAPELGVSMEELGAVIAGGTTSSVGAKIVMTQLRQLMFGILRPTEMAKKQFATLGLSVADLQKKVRDDGFIATLQWLRQEVGDDREAFSRLFESAEAVGLLFSITGKDADKYRNILQDLESQTGATNAAQETWAKTGFSKVELASNDAKLALDDLYNNAVVPLLNLFGQLPAPIQQVVVLFGVLSGASLLLFGSALMPLIVGLVVFIAKAALVVGAIVLVIAAIGLVAWAFGLLGGDMEKARDKGREFREKWDEFFGNIGEWTGDRFNEVGETIRPIWDTVTGWIGDRFSDLGADLKETWETWTSWFWDRVNEINPEIQPVWDAAMDAIGDKFESLGTRMKTIWDNDILPLLQRFGGWVGDRNEEARQWTVDRGNELGEWANQSGVAQGYRQNRERFYSESPLGAFAAGSTRWQPDEADIEALAGFTKFDPSFYAQPGASVSDNGPAPAAALQGIGGFLGQFLGGPATSDPALAASQSVQDNRTFNLNEGAIVVNTAAGQDPTEIARMVPKAIRSEFEDIPLAFDTDILR